MKFGLISLSIALVATPVVAAPGDVFALGAAAEKLWGEGIFTEGVDVAPDGQVYFSDMTTSSGARAPRTLRYDPATGLVAIFLANNGRSNGQKFGTDGRLWSVQASGGGTRDLRITSLDGEKSQVAVSGYNGKMFNSPNDLAFDASGRVYLTDTRYVGSEPIDQPLNAVYRIDLDGSVNLAVTDMLAPNGLAISPDGRTLYVSEHPYSSADLRAGKFTMLAMSIRAYELTPEGRAIHGRAFAEFGVKEGVDGMAVDADGNHLAAYRDAGRRGIRVFSPAGEEIDFLPLAEKPTNIAFGRGLNSNILYITAGKSLYRVKTNTISAQR
jgi:gluconolactonase